MKLLLLLLLLLLFWLLLLLHLLFSHSLLLLLLLLVFSYLLLLLLLLSFPHLLGQVPKDLCGVRPAADTRGIRLGHSNDSIELFGCKAQSAHDAANAGVAACNEGVCAEIDVEHCGVCSLDQDALALTVCVIHIVDL